MIGVARGPSPMAEVWMRLDERVGTSCADGYRGLSVKNVEFVA